MLQPHTLPCVELSALRMEEVRPLLDALDPLDLKEVQNAVESLWVSNDETKSTQMLRIFDGLSSLVQSLSVAG